jgi:hypothetical protein
MICIGLNWLRLGSNGRAFVFALLDFGFCYYGESGLVRCYSP